MKSWTSILCIAYLCMLLQAPVARSATIGLWLQDEGSGSVVSDSSGNGHDGAITYGGTWSTDSPFEPNAANNSLGGIREVGIPDAPALNPSGDFTIETWVKFSTLSGNQYLVSKRGFPVGGYSGYWLEASPASGVFDFITGGGVGSISVTEGTLGAGPYAALGAIQSDTWYHIAGVHTATENILYINGISNGGNGTAPMAASSEKLTFGYLVSGDKYGDNTLDEVRLSDRALSAPELGFYHSLAVPEPTGILLVCCGLTFGWIVRWRRDLGGWA